MGMLPLAGCSSRREWSLDLEGGVGAGSREDGMSNAGRTKHFHGEQIDSLLLRKFV